MDVLHICFLVSANPSVLLKTEVLERSYQKIYRKLFSFLYSHPKVHISFAFNGRTLTWFEEKHPEYLQLLRELTARKQIEIIGGAFYSPALPLLFPMDRNGQIELMTSTLRRTIGKRPRGMSLFCSSWDPGLIPCLQSSTMEYAFLDSSLIPPEKLCCLPHLVSEQGKSIKILPLSENLKPEFSKDFSADSYFKNLRETALYMAKRGDFASAVPERVLALSLDIDLISELVSNDLLESFFEMARFEDEENGIKLSTPIEFLYKNPQVIPSYIPAGISSSVAVWAKNPYKKSGETGHFPSTVYDFLLSYPRCKALYNRMTYVGMLISQCRGDKIRKKVAREKLWTVQGGEAFVCSEDGLFAGNEIRQYAYKGLTEAEKTARQCAPFKDSITSYDYTGNGRPDYICSMQQYFAVISSTAGSIVEFDSMKSCINYTDNLHRLRVFDGVQDDYNRGFFVEHLFSQAEYEEYKQASPTGSGIFSQIEFEEVDFDSQRREVQLLAKAEYSALKLPVSLRKKYTLSSSGMSVQYILKNEGPLPLSGKLVVESNFGQTDFSSENAQSYHVEAISAGERKEFSPFDSEQLKDLSFLQVTDSVNDISFTFEPNENAECGCQDLMFNRPTAQGLAAAGRTLCAYLCWDINLSAGMEMEKTVVFTIITPKRRRSNSKKSKV